MPIDFDHLDLFFAKCETALNFPDHIPFLSSISAAIRLTAAQIVIVVSALAALCFGIASLFNSHYRKAWMHCVSYIGHGLANTFRSFFAGIPLVNLGLIVYDMNKRFTYPTEELRLPVTTTAIPQT